MDNAPKKFCKNLSSGLTLQLRGMWGANSDLIRTFYFCSYQGTYGDVTVTNQNKMFSGN
jgi:hypothetical protein